MKIYLVRKAQIALLFTKKVTVPKKYLDFAHAFSKKSTKVLPEHRKINKHTPKLQKNKQLPYGPISYLNLVKLETLKTYIKTYLANVFIYPSKFPKGASIFFEKKPDGSLYLRVNYQKLNNFTIKNQYPFSLIRKSLN